MAYVCFICGGKDRPQFEFPSEPNLRQKWLTAVQNLCDVSQIQGRSTVCMKHFLKNSFILVNQKYQLSKGAVPRETPPETIPWYVEKCNKKVQANIGRPTKIPVKVKKKSLALQQHCEVLSKTIKRINRKCSICCTKLKHPMADRIRVIDKIVGDIKDGDDNAKFIMDLIESYGKHPNSEI